MRISFLDFRKSTTYFRLLLKIIPTKIKAIDVLTGQEINLMPLDLLIAIRKSEDTAKCLYQNSIITMLKSINYHAVGTRFKVVELISPVSVGKCGCH